MLVCVGFMMFNMFIYPVRSKFRANLSFASNSHLPVFRQRWRPVMPKKKRMTVNYLSAFKQIPRGFSFSKTIFTTVT